MREVIGEESYGHVRLYIERALRGEHVTYQAPFVFRGGRRGSIEGTHVPQVEPGGRVVGYATLVTDVTERHAAETALRAREEQVRGLLNSTSEGIWGLDTEGRCTFANPACARLLGYDSAEELVGRDMHELVHHLRADGTRCPKEECAIQDAFRSGREVECDDVLWRRDGTALNVRYRSSPILRDGQVAGAVVAFEDITGHKAAVEALRESEERLSRVMEASGVGTWEIDPLTWAITADAPLRALHEFPPDGDVDLETGLASIHPEDRERVRGAMTAALAGRDAGRYLIEYRVMGPEGRIIRWVEARGRAYFDAAGRAVRFLGTSLDITRRKEAELAREGLLEALPPPYLQRVARGREPCRS
ncbi:PAS domain S-box protein [Archangium sp.]|uniref:PAS domain S-box protein n=1 Tax=Archangium sp. TaxID=1872627 RepID=UPI002D4C3881|nr:PAS domain S-box protein [Archangium sp.]HYO57499.1 PAS domain S-box protein [Archangium sp.]